MDLSAVPSESLQSTVALFLLVVGVKIILDLLNGVLAVFSFFKRPETVEQMIGRATAELRAEMAAYARQQDVASLESRVSARLDGLHQSLSAEREGNKNMFQDILRALGKIEGLIERKNP